MSKDVEDKIIDFYENSGMSVEQVIFSLKRLLATARIKKERVHKERRRKRQDNSSDM